MKKTMIAIAVVGILMGAMCAGTVSARAGPIMKAIRSVGCAVRSRVTKARSRVASARAVFTRGRQIFTSGRALFTRGRQVFNSVRALSCRLRSVGWLGITAFAGAKTVGQTLRLHPLRAAMWAGITVLSGARTLHLGFKATRLRFKALRLGFKATRLRFKALRLGFKATRLRFKALRLGFKAARLKFKALRLGVQSALGFAALGISALALAKMMKGQQQQQAPAGAVGDEAPTEGSFYGVITYEDGSPVDGEVSVSAPGVVAVPKESSCSGGACITRTVDRSIGAIDTHKSTSISIGSQENNNDEYEYERVELTGEYYNGNYEIAGIQPGLYMPTVETEDCMAIAEEGQGILMEEQDINIDFDQFKKISTVNVPLEIDWENIDGDVQVIAMYDDKDLVTDDEGNIYYIEKFQSNDILITYYYKSVYDIVDIDQNDEYCELHVIPGPYKLAIVVNDEVTTIMDAVVAGEITEVAPMEYSLN
jgi:hypothetical protein